jgi:hypothetical protein
MRVRTCLYLGLHSVCRTVSPLACVCVCVCVCVCAHQVTLALYLGPGMLKIQVPSQLFWMPTQIRSRHWQRVRDDNALACRVQAVPIFGLIHMNLIIRDEEEAASGFWSFVQCTGNAQRIFIPANTCTHAERDMFIPTGTHTRTQTEKTEHTHTYTHIHIYIHTQPQCMCKLNCVKTEDVLRANV